jgi:hypothetical protein
VIAHIHNGSNILLAYIGAAQRPLASWETIPWASRPKNVHARRGQVGLKSRQLQRRAYRSSASRLAREGKVSEPSRASPLALCGSFNVDRTDWDASEGRTMTLMRDEDMTVNVYMASDDIHARVSRDERLGQTHNQWHANRPKVWAQSRG